MVRYEGLTQFVVDKLKDSIISGDIPGGTRLNEALIASELNVSRPPLREALQILEQQCLIQCFPRRGRFVVELTPDNLVMIRQAREMIESQAISILEEKGMRSLPSVKKHLVYAKSLPLPSESSSEKVEYLNAINEFHGCLVKSTDNTFLDRFYSIIMANIKRYIFMDMYQSIEPIVRQEDHEKIYGFIENGEYDAARKFLAVHIKESFERMNRILKGT